MKSNTYTSERVFNTFDFFLSHGQLLLRSSKNKDFEYNVDIIFFDVKYIQTPTSLTNISIKKIEKTELISYESVKSSLNYKGNELFEIDSKGEKFYISAAFFKVYENTLEFNETSLGMIDKGREKMIYSS